MKEEKEKQHWSIALKPYTLKELANVYGVCKKTLRKWLLPLEPVIGKRNGYLYTIDQVKLIFTYLQLPSFVEVEVNDEEGFYKKVTPKKE